MLTFELGADNLAHCQQRVFHETEGLTSPLFCYKTFYNGIVINVVSNRPLPTQFINNPPLFMFFEELKNVQALVPENSKWLHFKGTTYTVVSHALDMTKDQPRAIGIIYTKDFEIYWFRSYISWQETTATGQKRFTEI